MMMRFVQMKSLSECCGWNKLTFTLFFILQYCMTSVIALYCPKCISINCTLESKEECSQLRVVTEWELLEHKFYNFGNSHPAPCPLVNDTDGWKQMQSRDVEPCPNITKCSLGRIRLKIMDIDKQGNVTGTRYNYATVLGCSRSNSNLTRHSNESLDQKTGNELVCDHITISPKRKSYPSGLPILFEMDHCPNIFCNGTDYCIDQKESEIKILRATGVDDDSDSIIFFYLAVSTLIIIIMTVMLFALFCYFCHG